MHKHLDFYLTTRYGELYRERFESMSRTCMCWGFECSDGWFHIIDNLSFRITHYYISKDTPSNIPAVGQVKEKFGTLRFYTSGDDIIHNLISFAEDMSSVTCEICGKPAKTYRNGWHQTLCPDCYEKDSDTRFQPIELKEHSFVPGDSVTVLLNTTDGIITKALKYVGFSDNYDIVERVIDGVKIEQKVHFMYHPLFSYFVSDELYGLYLDRYERKNDE